MRSRRSIFFVPSENRAVEGAALLGDVLLELAPELAHEAEHRHRRAVAERADGVADDVGRDVGDLVELSHVAVAVLDLVEDAIDPAGALAAGRALTAGLVLVEARQVERRAHHARALGHDGDAAGAE